MKKVFLILFFLIIIDTLIILLCPMDILYRMSIYLIIVFFSIYLFVIVLKMLDLRTTFETRMRGYMYSIKKRNLYKGLSVQSGVRMHNTECIKFGDNVSIGKYVDLFPVGGKYESKIIIGNNVSIGDYNRFASCNCVEIEDDVLFAAYVHITDHSHEFRDVDKPVIKQGIFSKGPVKIGKGTWLGYRSEVLSGVTIGEHCVIAAGAIVTKDIPAFSVAAGIPAKVIKKYDLEKKEWIDV